MDENKALISEYLQALSGAEKTIELIERYVADQALSKHITDCEAAFPRYELIADDMIAERDVVTVRATFRGTQRAAFAGIEPTGRTVSSSLIIIYRLAEGKIVQHWMEMDIMSLLRQLSAPVDAAAA